MTASLPRIIKTDWPALAATWGAPMILAITWIHPLFFRPSKPAVSPYWLLLHVGVPFACACVAVLLWRIGRILQLFRRGVPATGTVTALRLSKDRGRLEFSYEVNGTLHDTWQPVHQSRDVLALEPGQEVAVLVSSGDPSVAIIRHLFEAPAPRAA